MTTNAICYVELQSSTPGQAGAFYQELFGWKGTTAEAPGGPYTELATSGMPAGLKAPRPDTPAGWIVYVAVEALDPAVARAETLGAQPVIRKQQIPEGVFAILRDPAGQLVGLFERHG